MRQSLIALVALAATSSWSADALPLQSGDIVVLEQGGGAVPAALVRVDRVTGEQDLVSSGELLSNEIGQNPTGFVYDPATGSFLVVDRAQKLIRVDGATGQQYLLSDGLPTSSIPTSIAIESSGTYAIGDYDGLLLRYDPTSNTSSVLASGGLIGGVSPWAVQLDSLGDLIVASITAGGNDVVGPPSRVIRVDPTTGAQTLIAELSDGQFRDFAVSGETAFIAIGSRGYPSSSDYIAELDLSSGAITPIFSGLQRVLDVDIDGQGRLVVLDQCLTLSPCAGSPVVYRSNEGGGLDVVSTNGFLFAPSRLAIVPEPGTALLGAMALVGVVGIRISANTRGSA